MITERDERAIEFITNFGLVTTNQINKAIYNNLRVCNHRLDVLTKDKILKQAKNLYSREYLYSAAEKKISLKQLKHYLIRTEMYLALTDTFDIVDFLVEKPMGSFRPDALCYISRGGKEATFFLEVEMNPKKQPDFNKYIDFYNGPYREVLGYKLPVVYMMNKELRLPNYMNYETLELNHNLSNLENIATLLK